MSSSCNIVVSYYVDSYGPTIRIDVESYADLLILRRVFQELAEGSIKEVRLHDLKTITMVGIEGVTLKLVSKEKKRTLERLGSQQKKPAFVWARTQDGWRDECVGLIEGLAESKTPGHQYLSREGVDDALVELSFQEHHHEHREH